MLGDIDRSLVHLFNRDLANPVFDAFFFSITDPTFLHLVVAVTAAVVAITGGRKGWLVVALALGSVTVTDVTCSYVLKGMFCRIRPSYALPELRMLIGRGGLYGFPSNHAADMFCLATAFSFFYRRLTIPSFTFATLVCLSRIYVGKHYPSDVLAGAVYGALVAGIFVYFGSMWLPYLNRSPSDAAEPTTGSGKQPSAAKENAP